MRDLCVEEWKQRDWTDEQGNSASDDRMIVLRIKKICESRAELYSEGYRVTVKVDDRDFYVFQRLDYDVPEFKTILKKSIR